MSIQNEAYKPNIFEYEDVEDECGNNPEETPIQFLLFFSGISISLIISYLLEHFIGIRIPKKLSCYIITIIITCLIKNGSICGYFDIISNDSYLILSYIPIYMLRTSVSTDAQNLTRFIPVAIVISSLVPIITFLEGLFLFICISWINFRDIFYLIAVFGTIQPFFLIYLLKQHDNLKMYKFLLQTEAILTFCLSEIIHKFESFSKENSKINLYIYTIAGSICVGFIIGKVINLILNMKWNECETIGIIVGSNLVIFSISKILNTSVSLTHFVFSCTILGNIKSAHFKSKSIGIFFKWIYKIVDLCVFMYCLHKILLNLPNFDFNFIYIISLVHFCTNLFRFGCLFILRKVLKKINKEINLDVILLVSCASNVSVVSLIYIKECVDRDGVCSLIAQYAIIATFLSLTLNNFCFAFVIRHINYQSITSNKLSSMVIILNLINRKKEEYIDFLKIVSTNGGDVNWKIVDEMTTLQPPPPYTTKIKLFEKPSEINTKIDTNPSITSVSQKFLESKRESRREMYLQMKEIIKKKYINREISQRSLTALIKIFDLYINFPNDVDIPSNNLADVLQKNVWLVKIKKWTEKMIGKEMPRVGESGKAFSESVFKIKNHVFFKYFVMCIILMIGVEITVWNVESNMKMEFIILNVILCLFFVEFLIYLFSYSYQRMFTNAIKIYFRNTWHIIEFLCTMASLIEYSLRVCIILEDPNPTWFTIIENLRLFRILRLLLWIIQKSLTDITENLESRLSLAYEIVTTLIFCYDEVLLILDRFVTNQEVLELIKQKLIDDRHSARLLMCKIEFQYPWIPLTIKTKNIILAGLKIISDAIEELEREGMAKLEDIKLLKLAVHSREEEIMRMKNVPELDKTAIFFSVPWIQNNKVSAYLFRNSQVQIYPAGSDLSDKASNGVYIIISGIVSIKYRTNKLIMQQLDENGWLPVYDYINTLEFNRSNDNLLTPGNVFGLLSYLTNRSNNCTITAETNIKVYFLDKNSLNEARMFSCDPINGLEANMWEYSLHEMVCTLLMTEPALKYDTTQEIYERLLNASVPTLDDYETFVVTDLIADVVLLDGIAEDLINKDIYTAPSYIPRHVKEITLCIYQNTKTKLLIIPIEDPDKYKLKSEEGSRKVELVLLEDKGDDLVRTCSHEKVSTKSVI